jgi:probable HAF family extracellular repeat protein
MGNVWRLTLVTVSLVLSATAGRAVAGWSLDLLGDLPEYEASAPYGISADGSTVVGYSSRGDYHNDYQPEAFRWTADGGIEGLGFLPECAWSEAYGVSGDGSVVAGYSQSSLGEHLFGGEAFRWTADGGMEGLGFLPGHTHSQAMGVSADGLVVVGYSRFDQTSPRRAFWWTEAGGMVDLGLPAGGEWAEAHAASADGSVIVGDWGTPSSGHRGFVWTEADGFLDLGDDVTWVSDVSADGSVVVGEMRMAGGAGSEAFRWTATTGAVGLGNLSTFPNEHGEASGISADGSLAVGHGATLRPLVWDAAHGTRSLIDLLTADGIEAGGLIVARDVALNDGTIRIVGVGNWMATYVVPEPSSLALALAGSLAVVAYSLYRVRSRRRR